MKPIGQRLIGLLAAMCLVLGLMPFSASAATQVEYYGREALSRMADGRDCVYVYDQIAKGVDSKSTAIDVSTWMYAVSVDDIDTVFNAYYYDHSEVYYLSGGYSYSYNAITQTVTEFRPDYIDLANVNEAAFEAALDDLILAAGITADMSDYEKSLLLHDTLAAHVEYDLTAADMHTAYGALVNGRAVCDGYAKAYQCLLQEAGISSHIVTGYSVNPSSGNAEGHAWNLVELDGDYYYSDVTWDDQGDDLYHVYLNTTEAILTEDHVITEPAYGLPDCTATTANYFTHNPDHVTTAQGNVDQMVALFEEDGIARVYVTGEEPTAIWDWFQRNVSTIARKRGITGQYTYGVGYLGREFHFTMTGKTLYATKPTANTGLVYTGGTLTGIPNGSGYTLTGHKAVNAGKYTATATLNEGYKWSDGTSNPITISWEIGKAAGNITLASADETALTITLPDTLDPADQLAVTANSNGIVTLRYYTDEACTEGESDIPYTVAGTYWIKAYLAEGDNHTAAESEIMFYTVWPQPETPHYGCVDEDDTISSVDALLVLQYATSRITLNDEELRSADVDGTPGVTGNDALMILQFATKKIGSFPVEQ